MSTLVKKQRGQNKYSDRIDKYLSELKNIDRSSLKKYNNYLDKIEMSLANMYINNTLKTFDDIKKKKVKTKSLNSRFGKEAKSPESKVDYLEKESKYDDGLEINDIDNVDNECCICEEKSFIDLYKNICTKCYILNINTNTLKSNETFTNDATFLEIYNFYDQIK